MFAISFIHVVCLFGWGFSVPLENVSLIWRRHHNGKGLEILTYARHRPLSCESSLACHKCSDIGNPFIVFILVDP